MVPARTARLTSRLAWTAPKRLSIWRSSMAGVIARPPPVRGREGTSHRALIVRHVIVHRDPPRLDVRRRLLDGGAHLRHVLEHLGLAVAGLDTLDVAAGEAADQRDVHAADEADLVGLGGERGEKADQVGALVLLEGDGLD